MTCLLHTRGCDGRRPCSIERQVHENLATPGSSGSRWGDSVGEGRGRGRSKMTAAERRRRVREMRKAGRWKR